MNQYPVLVDLEKKQLTDEEKALLKKLEQRYSGVALPKTWSDAQHSYSLCLVWLRMTVTIATVNYRGVDW